jgi:hypothetical protein
MNDNKREDIIEKLRAVICVDTDNASSGMLRVRSELQYIFRTSFNHVSYKPHHSGSPWLVKVFYLVDIMDMLTSNEA